MTNTVGQTQTAATDPQIVEAIRFLAGRCDYAFTRDNQGFSGVDTGLGHYLAELPADQWTPAQRHEGWALTRKYRRQLEEAGYDVDGIGEPPKPATKDIREKAQTDRVAQRRGEITVVNGEVTAVPDSRLEAEGDEFKLFFPYDAKLVDEARNISGRRWDGDCNRYPQNSAAAFGLVEFCERHDVAVPDDLRARLDELTEGFEKPPWGTVSLAGPRFVIDFPYERELVGQVQKIDGRRWDKAKKVNTVPTTPEAAADLTAFLGRNADRGIVLTDEAEAKLEQLSRDADALKAERDEMREISRAEDADFDVEGLGGVLRPFQRAGVKYAATAERTFIADDMGTGKTVQGLATVHHKDAFPVVVVCPSTVKLSWRDHVNREVPGAPNGWLPTRKPRVLEGRKPNPAALRGVDVVIVNYDILPAWVATLKALRPKALILDESHYIKSSKAQRSKAAKALAARIGSPGLVLCLTGTPNKNRPIEYAHQLEVMGRLEEFGGFMRFAKRYCGAYRDRFGWNFDGATNLEELNEKLRGRCFIRRRKSEIMKELPPKQIARVPIELSNKGEYARVEDDVIGWLREQVTRDAEFAEEIADLPEDEKKAAIRARQNDQEARARRAERLVQLNKLRLVSAQGKIKAATEWVTNFLEGGDEKLVVFADHVEVQKGLLSALRGYGPAKLLGEDNAEERGAQIKRFQNDAECRVIICSLKAGGIGVTLTAASNVVFVEQGWTPADMDQAEDRCHRMGQDDQVTAWYLLAEGTIDDEMAALLAKKRAVVTAAADGTSEDPSRVSIASELVDRLIAKGT